jgi:hypothetical protein
LYFVTIGIYVLLSDNEITLKILIQKGDMKDAFPTSAVFFKIRIFIESDQKDISAVFSYSSCLKA